MGGPLMAGGETGFAGRATLEDVARAAGVSLATVDRVVNRREGVREKTIARVEAMTPVRIPSRVAGSDETAVRIRCEGSRPRCEPFRRHPVSRTAVADRQRLLPVMG